MQELSGEKTGIVKRKNKPIHDKKRANRKTVLSHDIDKVSEGNVALALPKSRAHVAIIWGNLRGSVPGNLRTPMEIVGESQSLSCLDIKYRDK